ncbi:MAG TPA: DEAD/DEAH box helicase family protein [Micromonosporaceae bacterium]
MTGRRFFNSRERTALYLAADGRCTECGAELEPSWHADHINPHSAGGPTDVINGQALCPPCNLLKGDKIVAELRGWQAEALEKFLRRTDDFLCVATPGAGKTRFALAAAERLLQRGDIRKVIVVAPTSHMRIQWAKAAHSGFGIQLDAKFANPTGAVAKDFDGIAVTYQSVASQPLLYRRLATLERTLVILDEVHHGGDELSWGNALREAFGSAARRLLLSGTPDRTDGSPVPFVRYDEQKRFVADYSYDYGQALADRQGVVRQIAFPTFDGDTRWLDASRVEAKLRLSESDDATRANALRSALLPDGPWMNSVLRAANAELTRQRESVPDAGGLVVAADQFKAARYRAALQEICGEEVAIAISDLPDASERISQYAASTSRWIVAVAMVSEGVDIPRLVVGVYATNVVTELFFRQVAGRFVRTRHPGDDSCATLFIPSVEPLVNFAADIERTIPRALREAEERAARESKSDGPPMLDIDLVVPLSASEAVHVATILSGDSFADAELTRAEEYARLAGMPPSVTAAQVARLVRVLGGGRTVGAATVEIPQQPLGDQKDIIRKELKRRVGYLARLVDRPYSHIGADLNRACGDTVPTASLASLKRRRVLVEEWIAEASG